jgi:two-component system, chemotaxis family, sensor kinase CheA
MSDEIVREFLVESAENLDLLDRELVQLEKDPRNRERLGSIFRTIHTIKGTCGFLGFTKLESVTHVGENLLSRLRDGALELNPEITTALLQMVDAVRQMLHSIETTENEGERNDAELIKTLARLQQGAAQPAGTSQPCAAVPNVEPEAADKQRPRSPAKTEAPSERMASDHQTGARTHETKPKEDVREAKGGLADHEKTAPQEAAETSQSQATRGGVSEGSIRVDVVLLDKLMNLVGELVLARNQVLQYSNRAEDASIVRQASGSI